MTSAAGPSPSAEWRRLKPSGSVHAWVTPRTAVCGAANLNGTTNVFPQKAKRCPECVAVVYPNTGAGLRGKTAT